MSAIHTIIVFVILCSSVVLVCVVERLKTGKWPKIHNTNDEITAIQRDIWSLKSDITNIKQLITIIQARITSIENEHEREKSTRKTPKP